MALGGGAISRPTSDEAHRTQITKQLIRVCTDRKYCVNHLLNYSTRYNEEQMSTGLGAYCLTAHLPNQLSQRLGEKLLWLNVEVGGIFAFEIFPFLFTDYFAIVLSLLLFHLSFDYGRKCGKLAQCPRVCKHQPDPNLVWFWLLPPNTVHSNEQKKTRDSEINRKAIK